MKILNIFDPKIVYECQFYIDFMPMQHQDSMRQITFLKSLENSSYSLMRSLYALVVPEKLRPLAALYGVGVDTLLSNYKDLIRKDFVNSVQWSVKEFVCLVYAGYLMVI